MSGLPIGWTMAEVQELASPEPRSITDGPFGSNLKTAHYTTAGPRVVRLQNIADGHFVDDRAHISESHYQGLVSHSVLPGDLLVAGLGEILPRACLAPDFLGPAIVKADCFRLRLHPAVNPRYVCAILNSPPVRSQASKGISGVGRPRLNLQKVRALRVPLPPRREQDRIVAAIEEQFSRLDAGVAALERVRQKVKRMRASVLQRAVDTAYASCPVQVRLAQVLREPLRNGHSAKQHPGGTIPILTLTAVTTGEFSQRNVKMTAADPERVRTLWLKAGDILIERSNTPDLVGIARVYRGPDDFAVYPDLVIRARLDDTVVPEFAELALQAPSGRHYFRTRAQGISGSMPKIDQSVIEDFTLPRPAVDVQHSIVREAERQETLIQSLHAAMGAADRRACSLRSSILAAAFCGKLVPQDPNDEPASVLLERIAAERASSDGCRPARSVRQERLPI